MFWLACRFRGCHIFIFTYARRRNGNGNIDLMYIGIWIWRMYRIRIRISIRGFPIEPLLWEEAIEPSSRKISLMFGLGNRFLIGACHIFFGGRPRTFYYVFAYNAGVVNGIRSCDMFNSLCNQIVRFMTDSSLILP